MINKRLINTGVEAAPAAFDPLQNFETVTYTGNGSTQKITGYIRKGAAFNGSSSDIDLPSGVQSSTMAVSMFVFFTSTPDTDVLIEFENGYGINFLSSDSGYVLAQYANSNGSNVKSNSAITTNQWYHIAANFTSSSAELYIDKVQQTGGTVSNYVTADQNTIGSRRADAFIPAKIDQVRIFNKELSSSEITTLYDETSASATKSTTDIFDDGSGVALYELEGNALDTGGTYNGTATNVSYAYDGTPTNVNFLGMAFQPDLVWVKGRSHATFHILQDSVRGAGSGQSLYTNVTASEGTYDADGYISSLDTNGFTVAGGVQTVGSGRTYVAWCWKAGGAAVSNTDGSITSTVSANPNAGFSIVKYSGAGTTASVGHGLSVAPDLIIIKNTNNVGNWGVYTSIGGAQRKMLLNSTLAEHTSSTWLNTPSASVINIQNDGDSGLSGRDYIAYCFANIDGYQKVGSYTGGTGEVDVVVGFRPRWVMIKNTDTAASWVIFDTIRSGTTNPINDVLEADTSDIEAAVGTAHIDIVDNGFQVNSTTSFSTNNNGDTYIYLAIA